MSVAYDFAHSPATEFMSRPQHLLIDGRRVPASSGRTFKSLNPATGQVIAVVAEGNEADVEHAVAAARRAFEGPWRTMRASERGQILLRWADLLKAARRRDHRARSRSMPASRSPRRRARIFRPRSTR